MLHLVAPDSINNLASSNVQEHFLARPIPTARSTRKEGWKTANQHILNPPSFSADVLGK